jgi:hypothetical protein
MSLGAPKGKAVRAPHVAPVVLLGPYFNTYKVSLGNYSRNTDMCKSKKKSLRILKGQ